MGEPMIIFEGLTVRYGPLTAVDGLSLTVRRGEVLALLGPNGAGKTSALACIEGLRRPDAGRVLVAGHDVTREPAAVKALIGVQLQRGALFTELRAAELVELFAALYGRFPARAEVLALLGRFGLADKARSRPGQLSGGQLQRLMLALALVNDPQVVLLDEPTGALDPQARRTVWALVRGLRAEGRTVLLTTHSMEEAEALSDRVAMLVGGRLAALGAPAELVARHAPPLPPGVSARRAPSLEDAFLALAGPGVAEDSWAA